MIAPGRSRKTGTLAIATDDPVGITDRIEPDATVTRTSPGGEVATMKVSEAAASAAPGKTAFGLELALRAAIAKKTRVLVFSLEMSVEELAERALASLSGVALSRLQGAELTRSEADKVAQAAAGVREAELVFDANPAAMVTDIAAAARRERPGLIVIDYLQLMTTGRNQENRQAEVSEISRGLKLLAREAEVPVVALSQLSRNLENRHDKRPQLFDLRDSGAIEQDADIVIFVHHDTPGFAEGTVVEVIVAKHRNGPLGTAKVWFEPAVMRFGDLAR